MPRLIADAEVVKRDPAYVADEHKLGVLTVRRMRDAGLLDQVEEHFPVSRPRGHGALALFTAAVFFLLAGPGLGIRPFFEGMNRSRRRRYAALIGARSLPASSSISRALSRFDHEQVRQFVAALLAGSVSGKMLNHPAVHHHDALGEPWHTLDLDPTVHAIRRRDLPCGDELPPGERRAQGQPGYVGRKRGEARMRVVPVMHDGAGLWLAMVLLAEEGSVVPYCRTLMKSAMEVLAEHGNADRVIARGDGELGSVGAIRAITDSGAHPLVRLPRAQLIDREEVAARLRRASWYPVRRGESGLQREAAELGTFTLKGSEGSQDEGYVTVRVVVSRFLRASDPTHGVIRDGHQIELFATTLEPQRWPAAEVIELYGGRATIENRFAQEDREFDLERTFSFHPPGQEWMCGVGLFLWNEQVRAGWQANPPPAERPVQVPRPPLETLRIPPEVSEPTLEAPISAQVEAADGVQQAATQEIEAADEVQVEEPLANVDDDKPVHPDVASARATLEGVVHRAFSDVATWPGWRIEQAQLRCPENRRLFPYTATGASKAGGPRLSVRTEPWACNGCPIRDTCFPGRGPYKQITRTVTETELDAVRQAMLALKRAPRPKPQRRRRTQRAPLPPTSTSPVFVPPERDVAGPLYTERPRFLPAAARRAIRDYARTVDIILRVGSPTQRRAAPTHPLLADGAADRAHRRKTLQQARGRQRRPVRLVTMPSTTSTQLSDAT